MLPNLQALAGAWSWKMTVPPLVVGEWSNVAPADPTRWLLAFWSDTTKASQVSPLTDELGTIGRIIQPNNQLLIEYQKWGIVTQLDWYAFDGGGGPGLMVIEVFITKPKG